jgi:putative membrane protein
MASPHGGKVSAESFIQKAGQDGMAEVKLAEVAMQKSQNEAVHKFASNMEKDHGKANSELQSLASQKQISVASNLDSKHESEVTELSGKSGDAFDKAYAEHMVKAHKQAIALFKSAAASQDPEVAAFSKQTLPTLQEHQRMADKLASEVKVASADSSGAKQR